MIGDLRIRLLQILALYAPGATSVRVRLHRARGASIGDGVFIGTDAIIETSRPDLVCIGDRVTIGIRDTLIAHFNHATPAERGIDGEKYSLIIEDDVFLGPGVIVLPGVRIGRGAVVTAGSVVTSSVAPGMMVQGNPARPVARAGIPLNDRTSLDDFYRNLTPVGGSR